MAVEDRTGTPVTQAEIKGLFLRPADNSLDQTFTMQETGAGLYQVRLTLPEPGLWSLLMTVERGEAWHEVRARTSVEAAE